MADSYLNKLLGQRESINLIARQHWLVYLQSILPEIAIIILLIVGISVSIISFQAAWIWFSALLLILPIISIIRDTLIWWNKQYVITSHRVIQVAGIFNKDVTDSALEKVNDVKLAQSVWGRLFGYGNIEILTASELGINLFSRIADPVKFKTTMLDAKDKTDKEDGKHQPEGVLTASNLPDLILRLGDLRDKGLLTEEEFQAKKKELLA
jgi:uncharacterized membrane protein YdbT with pleckstrin-like domain